MNLSKLEAARRQLDVAARLFAEHDDHLAVHTLAGAAEEILGKLAERSDQQSMFQRMQLAAEQQFGRRVSPSELAKLVNDSRNSIKHAKDPREDVFEYDSDHSVVMLFRAMVNYQLVTGGLTDTMEGALVVLRTEHPAFLQE